MRSCSSRFLAPVHSKTWLVAAAALGCVAVAVAQSPLTEHTYRLDQGARPAAGSFADVAWLVGDWVGEAFGDRFEEVWTPPSAGTMAGLFKLLDGDGVAFYEIQVIAEEEGSLSLKVKHFSADFTAWEEKEDYHTFRLVRAEGDQVHFAGLSFHRISDEELHAYIALTENGELREEKLVYHRRP